MPESIRQMSMPELIQIILSMPSVSQNGTVDGTVNARVDSNNTVVAVGPSNVNARVDSMLLMPSIPSKMVLSMMPSVCQMSIPDLILISMMLMPSMPSMPSKCQSRFK